MLRVGAGMQSGGSWALWEERDLLAMLVRAEVSMTSGNMVGNVGVEDVGVGDGG